LWFRKCKEAAENRFLTGLNTEIQDILFPSLNP
jgi:hypothetical protein